MSQEVVAALANELKAGDISCPSSHAGALGRCAIASERTYFELIFDHRGLSSVIRGRYTGLYGLEVGAEERLCAAE